TNVAPSVRSAKAVDVGDYSGATNTDPVWRVKPTDHFPDGETPETFQGPVGRANCGPGSNPETSDVQGSVSVADRQSGRSSGGYWCNMEKVGVYGPQSPQPFEGAEWQFARYKDAAGHQCGYYSQRMAGSVAWFPSTKSYVANGVTQARPGTIVVDITNPADPTFVENIATPGMYNPWETLCNPSCPRVVRSRTGRLVVGGSRHCDHFTPILSLVPTTRRSSRLRYRQMAGRRRPLGREQLTAGRQGAVVTGRRIPRGGGGTRF
ncbi:MAG: hypothetical protein LC792_11950, partial [Actinobacteria bacterium]|nr:hypothetical protein [Actinomycetota bacterium]